MQTLDLSPLLIDVKETARVLSISKSKLYQLISDGSLGPMPRKFGGKTLFVFKEIEDWIADGRFLNRERWLEFRGEQNG